MKPSSARPASRRKPLLTSNQWEYSCAFLDHGEIEISNNQVENAIRPIVGRAENPALPRHQAGANASVIIFTVLKPLAPTGPTPKLISSHLLSVLPNGLPPICRRLLLI